MAKSFLFLFLNLYKEYKAKTKIKQRNLKDGAIITLFIKGELRLNEEKENIKLLLR